MASNPKEILSEADYANYRNVRAVAILFILLGCVFVLGGIGLAFGNRPDAEISSTEAIIIAIAGLGGVIGGAGALAGSRRWAFFVYGMAVVYIFAFPLGTILSIVMLKGLSKYLESAERIATPKNASVEQPETQ